MSSGEGLFSDLGKLKKEDPPRILDVTPEVKQYINDRIVQAMDIMNENPGLMFSDWKETFLGGG